MGIGLNEAELAANPSLHERRVADLNASPALPYDDDSFDAVICSLSVEYLTQPLEIAREIARVLTPGGVAIFTFSNRYFPTKVIAPPSFSRRRRRHRHAAAAALS